jgi:hypothetical protein
VLDSCGSCVGWEVGSELRPPGPSMKIRCCHSSLCSPEAKGHTQCSPPQNREHGAGAFDLGDNAVVCVVGPSSAVVAAGHGCGRDGVKPLGRRSFRSGSEVDDDNPKPSWHRPKCHGTELGDGVASAST